MSVVTQTISVFYSMDLDSQPKPFSELISLASQKISLDDNSEDMCFVLKFILLVNQSGELEPEPELMSLIHQILSLVISMDISKWKNLISLSPQVEVIFEQGKFIVQEEVIEQARNYNKWDCLPIEWKRFKITAGEEDVTHFFCTGCNGEKHKEYEKAPVEIKHPKHSLQLVLRKDWKTRDHACITPIYFGNFYSCVECEYILHETCANLSRKTYHPIHAHMLTLVRKDDSFEYCSACRFLCTSGFFYECSKGEECDFKLHVQCATISEPLVHGSHIHPLYLTSEPREKRECCVCKEPRHYRTNETFNCIECDCDFALCFGCATIPEKVRYKHDNHTLTLSYGEERSHETYWCEACEGEIKPKERFYKCDEYCCVTLHMECLIGKDLYMKPPLRLVLPNNHHMTRPFCYRCKKRCPHQIVIQDIGMLYCSIECGYPGLYMK